MAVSSLTLPKNKAGFVRAQYDDIALEHPLDEHPALIGFWLRWKGLHQRFISKISKIGKEASSSSSQSSSLSSTARSSSSPSSVDAFLEKEHQRLLLLRSRILSSSVQYLQREAKVHSEEARIFAALIGDSDRVLMAILSEEVERQRKLYTRSVRTRRVIGAYSRN